MRRRIATVKVVSNAVYTLDLGHPAQDGACICGFALLPVVIGSLCEHLRANWGGGNKHACRGDQDGTLQYKDEIQRDAFSMR
ncbi:hypothetical protein BG61_06040 [Caballeronia glathei]|uniref:Uncharacterized protein n=1 Tax=Caballeronia glathei TaxID=60547 RepID=A0A069PB26_9BURK|nr:hypothetical protein BG61_06040 [Caballeronia glathei]